MSFIPTMTPKEAEAKLNDSNFVLLDVRENSEYDFVKVEGAMHGSRSEVPARISEIDSNKEIGVLCLSGGRSGKVTGYLMREGFTNVKNIVGGITRYSDDVDQSLAKYRLQNGNLIPL